MVSQIHVLHVTGFLAPAHMHMQLLLKWQVSFIYILTWHCKYAHTYVRAAYTHAADADPLV